MIKKSSIFQILPKAFHVLVFVGCLHGVGIPPAETFFDGASKRIIGCESERLSGSR